jgi:competence protein ComEC
VLKLIAPGGTVLIPADVERRSEEALLSRGEDLAADVIVAGHHGSKTSSTAGFVSAVRAGAVVFSVGYRNRFGHPHQDVVERYRDIGSTIYRTDGDGAVLIDVTPEGGVRLDRYRALYRRYWLDAPETPCVSDNSADQIGTSLSWRMIPALGSARLTTRRCQ